MDRRNNIKTTYMAKGGLFTALGVICIYISTIVPVNKGYLLTIASLIIPLSVITTNVKNSIIVYTATCILSILICGLRGSTLAYIIFFGLFGFVKYYIERIRKIYIEIILKLVYFNACLFIALQGYTLFFSDIIVFNGPIYLLIIGAEIGFVIYDYVITLFIGYINRRFKL